MAAARTHDNDIATRPGRGGMPSGGAPADGHSGEGTPTQEGDALDKAARRARGDVMEDTVRGPETGIGRGGGTAPGRSYGPGDMPFEGKSRK